VNTDLAAGIVGIFVAIVLFVGNAIIVSYQKGRGNGKR
jgi:hypothetical protein